jgi:tRNA modification GTPase
MDLRGLSIALVDTAGVHETSDPVEQEGVSRARQAADSADLLIAMLDRSRPIDEADRAVLDTTRARPRVVVANKIDAPAAWSAESLGDLDIIPVSVRERVGLDAVASAIEAALGRGSDVRDAPAISNVRHITLMEGAQAVFDRARRSVVESGGTISEEFLLSDLQEAAALLQEVSGRRTPDDLLRRIFDRFCIGK